ncbi:YccT family protein [Acinetobacter sp. WZC-1]|uniref:YccT family protein n=1 Tax=Acinetobacter sp. WZC-1 TaxID=3459034 RepID=UPI00403DDED6
MTFKLSMVTLGLLMSSSVFAAVTITVPEEIVMLAVNDQEVNAGLFRTKKNDYKVDAGNVALSVRYQQYFEHMSGEHDILKSGVVTIQAPALQDGQKYTLALVNAPSDFDTAKKYAEQPTIALYDKNNQLVVQQTGANNEPKPWLTGGLFGRVFDLTSDKKTPANQPAPVYVKGAAAQSTSTVAAAPAVTTATVPVAVDGNAADQQLIQIWKKASKAERQRFMSWLAEQ